MIERLKIRIKNLDEGLAAEMIKTATDRILLRAGLKQESLPSELESICVEVVAAMLNKHQMNHEGVDSEQVDVFSVKFANNLLDQYDDEFSEYKRMYGEEQTPSRGKVMFI